MADLRPSQVDMRVQVKIVDFMGLNDNADPRDTPPGTAQRQVNVCCIKAGELMVRHGFKAVTFE
jgi:hypothetical protein